jgi:hypothetical protein
LRASATSSAVKSFCITASLLKTAGISSHNKGGEKPAKGEIMKGYFLSLQIRNKAGIRPFYVGLVKRGFFEG